MQKMIQPLLKYYLFAAGFSVFINLIYLAVPIYMMTIYDRVLFSFSKATLYTLSLGVVISLVAMGLMDYLCARMLGQAGNRVVKEMEPLVLQSMYKDAAGMERPKYTGGIADLERLRNAVARGHVSYVFDLPWILVYFWVLYMIHPLVAGVSIAGIFMVAAFQQLLKVLENKRYTIADTAFRVNLEFTGICLNQARLIKGMGMLSAVTKILKSRNGKVLAVRSEADALHAGGAALIRVLQLSIPAAVFGAGAFVFFTDELTAGAVFAGVLVAIRLCYPFEQSLSGMKSSIEAMAAYKRLKTFVDTRAEKEKLSLPIPEGKLDAKGVSLVLEGKPVLHDISFSLEPGESLGILGPSAVGKTCLCRVLTGVWPASMGKIRLDGADISQWPDHEWGKYVGYMPQESFLFPVSVAENIARLEQVDSEKVVKAARLSGSHDMILKLAQGYDTVIDQTGKNLAAGQKQMIAFARALYGDPKFVVLDEPHAHLDDIGLRMLATCLKTLKQEKITTVVISDRPNILLGMDKLLVIAEGQVAIYGPADKVLAKLSNKQPSQKTAGV